jgi:hypothetical protein
MPLFTSKLIIHSRKGQEVPFRRGRYAFEAAKERKEFWETQIAHIMSLRDLKEEAVAKLNEQLFP